MSKGNIPGDKKRRFRADGTAIWGKRAIDGPGVWVTCVKGKEKQTVGELYDLFGSLDEAMHHGDDEDGDMEDGEDLSLEAQIAKEVAAMRKPRKEQRFANCTTSTPCVIFISCKPPIDPVSLVVKHVTDVVNTGVTKTRYTQRMTPVSSSCVANIPEIQALCRRVLVPFFSRDPSKVYTYKIELRIRNHNSLSRQTLLEEIAACVPEGHKVDLSNPEVFVLVEVFKSVCGMSVVEDYYRLQKFNVMEIANAKNEDVKFRDGEGRMSSRHEVGEMTD